MAVLGRALASLQVGGDDLDPAAVTARLACDSTDAYARGDVIAQQTRLLPRTAPRGMWSLFAPETAPADVDAQVSWLVSVTSSDLTAWRWLGERFDVRLFCGWFMSRLNEGLTMSPATLGLLGERGIRLDLDLYSHGD